MDYETVEVTGPGSVVDKITQARVQVDLTNKNVSVMGQYVYDLCDANNKAVDAKLITTNVEAINLTVNIQRVKEIQLTLNTIYGGGATDKNCIVTIEPQTIRVSGSDVLLENLNVLELGTLDLAEYPTDQTLTFKITLPEGVTNETGVNEAVVTVEFGDLKLKKLNVTNIQAINVPAGMDADIYAQMLEITVRGPVKLVDRITAQDVIVKVDFEGAQPGTARMRAIVTVSSAYTGVGAVGVIEVTASLREAPRTLEE